MQGRHNAEAIFDLLPGITTDLGLQKKTVRDIHDNTAKMKKAFQVWMVVPAEGTKEGSHTTAGRR